MQSLLQSMNSAIADRILLNILDNSVAILVGVCSAIAVRTSLARQPLSRSEQLSLKLPDNLKEATHTFRYQVDFFL
ncbi:hypothetical protein Gasu_63040 isoform 1 [Galdieria sulphuraria]|uniref:Uncharacterized protein n=1 Tax=Galdieria sulphuraria TaxID=130081 RepID=M2X873_GALSU|nr:hypothetical protein Gasu_63040 isoform 1 [Galdieria sulphuraria]EME26047.1 hypothetical protein isoform 1 [Galdieria sulphuraria]|eukprot:XP_005702567.1 hypothetical protein isoform 1 [Galdieria sulphuraria]